MFLSLLFLAASQVLPSAALPRAPYPRITPRQVGTAYATTEDGRYALTQVSGPVSGNSSSGSYSTWLLNIDDSSSGYKQRITGFGAAVTDATVAVINDLPAGTRAELLNNLMTSAGVNFQLMRHTIASSDLSADPAYTYDDNGGHTDTSMSGFNLGDRGYSMASMLSEMKSLQAELTILGSSWAPPGWMQLDGVLTGTTVNNNLNPSYVSEFAQYFVDYIKAYANIGASIDAITIQNEPLNSQAGYPTMYMYAENERDWIQNNVGPALRNAGLSTSIWAYDHNTDQPSFPQTVLDGAREYVDTVAWHCYATDLNWGVLTDFHNTNPGVTQYMTECWTSQDTAWSQAADFTMGPLQNWASGSIAWTLATDTSDGPHLSSGGCSDCRGLVVVNTSAGSYEFTIDYYMMGQFSKFIPRGAVVLNGGGSYTYGDGTGIQSVATVNPNGERVVVIENKFGNDVYVTVSTTSGQTWSGLSYANSVVTWILPAL